MESLESHIEFVNQQITFHVSRAKIYGHSEFRKKKHLETAERFESLLEYLKQPETTGIDADTDESAKTILPKQLRLSLTPKDIEGLPEELLAELSVSASDKTEFLILSMIEAAGGLLSLDHILVGVFRETAEISKRTAMTNRLYRMVQKGLVYSVPGKKGVYSAQDFSEEEVENLLNA